jgi:hypothetical protein
MRKMLLTSAIALLGLAAIPASAMPVAPLSNAPTSITLVAMGCGPGWTRGPYGHCHPMGYGVAVVPGPYYGFHPYARPYAYRHCWIGRWGYRHCNL